MTQSAKKKKKKRLITHELNIILRKKFTNFQKSISWSVVFPFLVLFRFLDLQLSLVKTKLDYTLFG